MRWILHQNISRDSRNNNEGFLLLDEIFVVHRMKMPYRWLQAIALLFFPQRWVDVLREGGGAVQVTAADGQLDQ